MLEIHDPTEAEPVPPCHRGELLGILARIDLHPVFQPILNLRQGSFLGYETLIRGPASSPLHRPLELFKAAQGAGLSGELEHVCREVCLRAFARLGLPGNLFINVTPGCLLDPRLRNGQMKNLLHSLGIPPGRVVLELTENQRVTEIPEVHKLLSEYRAQGYRIAIDDLGEGFSNLRMWSEVRPDFVKIDRHFVHGIAEDEIKHHFVRAMQDLAEICHAPIIAEGIERQEDLKRLRDMNIACGQGFLIAMPDAQPLLTPSREILECLHDNRLSISPGYSFLGKPTTAGDLARLVQPVQISTRNEAVIARFDGDAELDVLPVLDGVQPVGLINRHSMIDRFARPFRKEVYGRRHCELFMNQEPLIVDHTATVQELAMMLAHAPRHHLYDGFIVVQDGRYLGVGNSHDLMALITEMQITAARYANPLTQLPGNVPINEHIDQMLDRRLPFVVAYIDIDRFKPFNDYFGYRRGDDMIQLLGRLVRESCDNQFDFVGHIGGDDFMVVFQSSDWESRCEAILLKFSLAVAELLDAETVARGGYVVENRKGEVVFEALPGLSVGAVRILPGHFESHREVAVAASEAKKQAKKRGVPAAGQKPGRGHGTLFVERRDAGSGQPLPGVIRH